MNSKTIRAALIAAMLVGVAGPALAGVDSRATDRAEMDAALASKVSLTEAVKAAEAQSGGQAMEVVFGDENGRFGYEVTTITPDREEHNLFVDGSTGSVVKDKATGDDRERDDDAEHSDDRD